jgi:hypothetical protein
VLISSYLHTLLRRSKAIFSAEIEEVNAALSLSIARIFSMRAILIMMIENFRRMEKVVFFVIKNAFQIQSIPLPFFECNEYLQAFHAVTFQSIEVFYFPHRVTKLLCSSMMPRYKRIIQSLNDSDDGWIINWVNSCVVFSYL